MLNEDIRRGKPFSLSNQKFTTSGLAALSSGIWFLLFYKVISKIDFEDSIISVYSWGLQGKKFEQPLNPSRIEILGVPIFDFDLVLGTRLPLSNFSSQLSGVAEIFSLSESQWLEVQVTLMGLVTGYIVAQLLSSKKRIGRASRLTTFFIIINLLYSFPLLLLHKNDWPNLIFAYITFLILCDVFHRIESFSNEFMNQSEFTELFRKLIFLLLICTWSQLSVILLITTIIVLHAIIYYSNWLLILRHLRLNIFDIILVAVGLLNLIASVTFVKAEPQFSGSKWFNDEVSLELLHNVDSLRSVPIIGFVVLTLYIAYEMLGQDSNSKLLKFINARRLTYVALVTLVFALESHFQVMKVSTPWMFYYFLQIYACLKLARDFHSEKRCERNRFLLRGNSYKSFPGIFVIYNLGVFVAAVLNIGIFEEKPFKPPQNSISSNSNFSSKEFILQQGDRMYIKGDLITREPLNTFASLRLKDLSDNKIASLGGWTKVRSKLNLASGEKRYENRNYIEICQSKLAKFLQATVILIPSNDADCLQEFLDSDYSVAFKNTEVVVIRPSSYYTMKTNLDVNILLTERENCPLYEKRECVNSFLRDTQANLVKISEPLQRCTKATEVSLCISFDFLLQKFSKSVVILPISYNKGIEITSGSRKIRVLDVRGFVGFQATESNYRITYKPNFGEILYTLYFPSVVLFYAMGQIVRKRETVRRIRKIYGI